MLTVTCNRAEKKKSQISEVYEQYFSRRCLSILSSFGIFYVLNMYKLSMYLRSKKDANRVFD